MLLHFNFCSCSCAAHAIQLQTRIYQYAFCRVSIYLGACLALNDGGFCHLFDLLFILFCGRC